MARKKKITLPTEDDYSKEVGLEDRWHMVRLEEWSVMLYDERTPGLDRQIENQLAYIRFP